MADNPLHEAIKLGVQANNDLGLLFARLGTKEHPNTPVIQAYRNANRAMKEVIARGGKIGAAKEVTSQLKSSVKAGVMPVFRDAGFMGHGNAIRQLKAYNVNPPGRPKLEDSLDGAYGVIDATLYKQEAAILALLLTGADESEIVGDSQRQGVLRPSEILAAAAFWAASLWWNSFDLTASKAGGGFQKQAIAALDARTTDCCLRVHSQIQPLNTPFHLTGTPRYADDIDWPPFHNYCRTSGVLYLPGYDDGITDLMASSANQVLSERAAGLFIDRHPADAFIE